MTRREFLALTAVALPSPAAAFRRRDDAVFDRILSTAQAKNWRDLPIGVLVGEIGRCFLETPYVANTLETSGRIEDLHR